MIRAPFYIYGSIFKVMTADGASEESVRSTHAARKVYSPASCGS
jgi:hypothetical protein